MRAVKLLVLIAALALPHVAWADPVQITSGFLNLSSDGFGDIFVLNGTDFAASGSGQGTAGFAGMPVGQTVDLSGTYQTFPAGTDVGVLTMNGTTQTAYIRSIFQIAADPFVAGDFSGSHTFTTPFSLTGTLTGFSSLSSATPLFTLNVAGSGIASFAADRIDTFYLNRNGVNFRFESATGAATPEPASLLLVTTGLVGLAARRRPAATRS